jgi:putative dimethyl sulfoxide reductase chaperone
MTDPEPPRTSVTDAPQSASVLQSQLAVLDLLRRLFLGGLTDEFLGLVGGIDVTDLDKVSPASAGLGRMIAAAEVGLGEDAKFGDRLRVEYTRLFEGPGQMPVVPFASFHLSRSKALMTQDTLAVRARYLEAGLAVEALNRVPDDYIGIELEFLWFLTREALVALQAGDVDAAKHRLAQRYAFVEDHVQRWMPLLAGSLSEATQEEFFAGLAAILIALPATLAEPHI